MDESGAQRVEAPDTLAANALGQLAKHPRVASLRRFITGWYLSYVSADSARGVPEADPQERLCESGDNLPNVIQYLEERHSERLGEYSASSETVCRVSRPAPGPGPPRAMGWRPEALEE